MAPIASPRVASRWIGDSLILAGEQCSRSLVLDRVSGIVWESLDGTTDLGEIASDVAELFGDEELRRKDQLVRLVEGLTQEGFIQTAAPLAPPLPRRIIAKIPEDSCIGRRIGLGRTRLIQAKATDGASFRFGCTMSEITEAMAPLVEHQPLDDSALQTIVLRATASRSGRPRLQQIFDTMGDSLYAARSLPLAIEAFHRTVTAKLDLGEDPWLQCLVIHRSDRALLVHPTFAHLIIDQARETLYKNGLELVPSSFVKLSPDGVITSAPDRFGGAPVRTWELAGVLCPESVNPVERYRLLLEMAMKWDHLHLDLIDQIAALDSIVEIATVFTAMNVIEAIHRTL